MDGHGAGTADVWLIRTDQPAQVLARYAAVLDPLERRRADELLHPAHRRRFVAAHGAVRHILARYLDTAADQVRWRYGENGKPRLDADGPHVNLSHSADLAVLAVSHAREVGVDLQWCSPTLTVDRLSRRYFPAAEAAFVAEAATAVEAVSRFVVLWARKEALVKAAGGRIIRHLTLPVADHDRAAGAGLVVRFPGRPGAFRVRDLAAPSGFHAAVALRGTAGFEVRQRWWRDGHDGDLTASDSDTSTSSTPRSHDSRSAGET